MKFFIPEAKASEEEESAHKAIRDFAKDTLKLQKSLNNLSIIYPHYVTLRYSYHTFRELKFLTNVQKRCNLG